MKKKDIAFTFIHFAPECRLLALVDCLADVLLTHLCHWLIHIRRLSVPPRPDGGAFCAHSLPVRVDRALVIIGQIENFSDNVHLVLSKQWIFFRLLKKREKIWNDLTGRSKCPLSPSPSPPGLRSLSNKQGRCSGPTRKARSAQSW